MELLAQEVLNEHFGNGGLDQAKWRAKLGIFQTKPSDLQLHERLQM